MCKMRNSVKVDEVEELHNDSLIDEVEVLSNDSLIDEVFHNDSVNSSDSETGIENYTIISSGSTLIM